MAQLNPSQYLQLTTTQKYGKSYGLYYDVTNSKLVVAIDGSIVASANSLGLAADLEFSGEAQGDILRRGASVWAVHSAKASGQILVGDGTDIVSVAVSGDATLAANGALTVADVTVGSDATGDILYKSSATALARLAKGAAGAILQQNAATTAPQWAALSGDATIADGGAVTLSQALLQKGTASFAKAAIIGTAAGELGHANGGVVIAAPAAGYALEFVSGIVIMDYDTAAYTGGGNVSFNYAGGGAALSGVVSFANSIGGGADKVAIVLPAVPTNNQLAAATGINLVVAAAPTDPGTAAGVVRAICCYRRHTTGL